MSSLFQTIRREWWGMVPPVPGPWPREDVALVEQMQAVRPGLTAEQAHTALQALRTLGAVVHRGGHTCPIPGHAADGDEVCTAQTVGVWDIPLRCAIGPLSAHTGDWHQDARGSRWRDSLAGSTRIHAADSPPPQASPEWTAHLHRSYQHPGWEYATTTGPRKQWDDSNVPPVGPDGLPDASWERNSDAGRDGWERFDYTEESYWRRPVQHG